MTPTDLRKQYNMSQREFAAYFGIPRRTVENWDSGTNQTRRGGQSAQKGNTTMKIIKIWRIHFPYAGVTFYAFSQNRADSTCDLFVKNYGDPVVDVVLVPVDPYVPVDASLDPSGLVERHDGVVFPYIDSDGVISDPHGYITIWKSRGWNGVVEEVIP